jgi:hypothetical protein
MQIKVIKERILKNGDSLFIFEFDKDFKKAIELRYNKKYSANLARLFILEGLKNSLSNELDKEFDKAKKLNKIKE